MCKNLIILENNRANEKGRKKINAWTKHRKLAPWNYLWLFEKIDPSTLLSTWIFNISFPLSRKYYGFPYIKCQTYNFHSKRKDLFREVIRETYIIFSWSLFYKDIQTCVVCFSCVDLNGQCPIIHGWIMIFFSKTCSPFHFLWLPCSQAINSGNFEYRTVATINVQVV